MAPHCPHPVEQSWPVRALKGLDWGCCTRGREVMIALWGKNRPLAELLPKPQLLLLPSVTVSAHPCLSVMGGACCKTEVSQFAFHDSRPTSSWGQCQAHCEAAQDISGCEEWKDRFPGECFSFPSAELQQASWSHHLFFIPLSSVSSHNESRITQQCWVKTLWSSSAELDCVVCSVAGRRRVWYQELGSPFLFATLPELQW